MILGEKYDNKSPRTHLRTFKISLVIYILQFFTQNKFNADCYHEKTDYFVPIINWPFSSHYPFV